MNIEKTAVMATAKDTDNKISSSSVTSPKTKDDSKPSFQDELKTVQNQNTPVKTNENTEDTATQTAKSDTLKESSTKSIQTEETTEAAATQRAQGEDVTQKAQIEKLENEQTEKAQETTKNNLVQQTEKNKLIQKQDAKNSDVETQLNELNSKIATINELKNSSNVKTQSNRIKKDEKTDKSNYCATIKMDNNDIKFFVNLVNNQQMTAQGAQANMANNPSLNNFTEIKSEATQQTVQVSAALMDSINESYKTNKPFRIDFDSDVAVIMKVDKDGVLSANFIPGSAAVENYLRNNIPTLQQSFNNQNLPYNELSYSRQQKQDQQEKQQNNSKENENE